MKTVRRRPYDRRSGTPISVDCRPSALKPAWSICRNGGIDAQTGDKADGAGVDLEFWTPFSRSVAVSRTLAIPQDRIVPAVRFYNQISDR